MASPPFSVNDAVHVVWNGKKLEGVVAFTGKVVELDDDDGAASADWIGVRLTGSSVGLGQHDGTVGGRTYFTCPARSGVFVGAGAVTGRSLTRLEELRLRRELAGTAVGGTATKSPAKPAAAAHAPEAAAAAGATEKSAAAAPSKGPAASASAAGTGGARSRLEELRQRREALKQKRESPTKATASSSSPTAATATTTTTSSPARGGVGTTATAPPPPESSATPTETVAPGAAEAPRDGELKRQVADLQQKLGLQEEEADKLREQLAASRREADAARSRVHEAEKKLEGEVVRDSLAAAQTLEDATQLTEQLESERDELRERLDELREEAAKLRRELDGERRANAGSALELTRSRAEATALRGELEAATARTDHRASSDAAHYKERARLQAEVAAANSRIAALERERTELEAAVEDVTVDKEQLQEEKEILEDRVEELKLDAETAQMEVEELKLELEDARASADRVKGGGRGGTADDEEEEEDAQQALQVQNARLRDALIRLREQSALEKMEVTRQLRAAEKDAAEGRALTEEVTTLRATKEHLEEQVADLKDMVEQGAAFEGMVEDLSDRVLQLEEEIVALQAINREMEEAAELTTEMEEVQAEELKALNTDLEGRDTIIRNLEEAIRMQRRREEDFRRTVTKYKTTVDTLKQEKQALLEMQQGGEGEKSNLIASSQKALARAAQLVADAAAMRKREAQAALDHIDHEIYRHFSTRLESLLPHSVVASELSAIKGELLVSKVIGKASKTLEGVRASFRQSIRPSLPPEIGKDAEGEVTSSALTLTDEVQQQVSTMIHQAEFAQVLVDVSSALLRFLAAGQWPDLVSPEASTEIGSILGHHVLELDSMLGTVLKSLKEEGSLTVEQSNLGALQLAMENTMQSLRTDLEREGGTVVPPDWNPPSWQLLKDASSAKFSCLGAAAALSFAVNVDGSTASPLLGSLYGRVEQCSSQASNACLRMSRLDLTEDALVADLSDTASEVKTQSAALLKAIQAMLLSDGKIESCESSVTTTLEAVTKLGAKLRSANLNPEEEENYHPLSPEVNDAWYGVAKISGKVRSIDADPEDVNHLIRARKIDYLLTEAVENEPKLATANAKVANLEKSLASRSKEIAMQNARLSELENFIAKTSATPVGRGKAADFSSAEEASNLKEENRVLTEAMEVLQREVEMYENEIRALKDFKSPNKRGPRRSVTSISDFSPASSRGLTDDVGYSGALEATLFRPALQAALHEAARWKAASMSSSLLDLPPLPSYPKYDELKQSEEDLLSEDYLRLSSALANYRLEKASITIVDLTSRDKTPRAQQRDNRARTAAAAQRLESVILQSIHA